MLEWEPTCTLSHETRKRFIGCNRFCFSFAVIREIISYMHVHIFVHVRTYIYTVYNIHHVHVHVRVQYVYMYTVHLAQVPEHPTWMWILRQLARSPHE